MNKTRLEAFSDGVLAIIVTIMVLEIKVPHGSDWSALRPLIPVFISYLLSFLTVGIYWGNHHHLLHAMKHPNGKIILANLFLLLCLSLLPFATGWMGENHFAPNTITLYAIVFILCGLAWSILQAQILCQLHEVNPLRIAIEKLKIKAAISAGSAALSIPFAYYYPIVSGILFVLQSVIWLIPDQRVERALLDLHTNNTGHKELHQHKERLVK